MKRKKIGLVILDGYGIGEANEHNAIYQNDHFIKELLSKYPHNTIHASGRYMGLHDNQFGNSEIGHLTIGAGTIILNDEKQINSFIDDQNYRNPLLDTIKNDYVHIVGLYSTGKVHASHDHIKWLISQLYKRNKKTILHILTDGRDSYKHEFHKFIDEITNFCSKHNAVIKSLGGRYFGMDRDQRWERTSQAFNVMFFNENTTNKTLEEIFNEAHSKNISDEFIEPVSFPTEFDFALKENDTVIIANYRADRMMQMCHLLKHSDYFQYRHNKYIENINLFTMVEFPGINSSSLFKKQIINETLGDVLKQNNLRQARIAETEKYAHVSYFFDGGIDKKYPSKTQILVPSKKIKTYDLDPTMSASLITKVAIDFYHQYDVFIINYANADMVGHTGNLEKTKESIKHLDSEIKKLYDYFSNNNGILFITADHGNADCMVDEYKQVITSHTNSKVLFVITDNKVKLKDNVNYSLANVAPTILDYLGIDQPLLMKESMLEKNR
ncbi:2,3-bisphosphoglycerate-independent phosphoglycerate mutase [Ureaplasma canigenitalium]|uniref:2,3-bisphosphoglycerate-independent phosphoglycerate mutase n=1 Tax=Ureaplasma canigenitalium TaxID=42092 RepID=UPI0004E168DC|nr:2,3-bisphosphoglycerate-independent phosphoglycerate mutase [Ureaplasma canigenitalium]